MRLHISRRDVAEQCRLPLTNWLSIFFAQEWFHDVSVLPSTVTASEPRVQRNSNRDIPQQARRLYLRLRKAVTDYSEEGPLPYLARPLPAHRPPRPRPFMPVGRMHT